MEERSLENSSVKKKSNINIKESETEHLKNSLTKEIDLDKKSENDFDILLNKLQNKLIIVNRYDYYGNSIPLGAFCYAVSFILLGFYESEIYDKPDKFIYFALLFFGGLGQITAGIFEYIKARTFPTILYLNYGFYFITFFLLNYKYSNNDDKFTNCKKVFYGCWAGLSFPIFIGSLRINVIYIIQNFSAFIFFVLKCIGECRDINILKNKISGILELVTGFFSIYICFSQMINEHFKKNILPTIKLKNENEIDI